MTECFIGWGPVTGWEFDEMFYRLRIQFKTCLQIVVLLLGISTECFTGWEPVTGWEFDEMFYRLRIQFKTCLQIVVLLAGNST